MYKDNKNLSSHDYEYMNSLSEAVLQIRPRKLHLVLWFWFFTIVIFLLWASFTSIDEITRGSGEVVPSGENQIVQNLEGGIVEEILVKEGDIVKKDQILIKINNKKSESTYETNHLKGAALKAKITRLKAQANNTKFEYDKNLDKNLLELYQNEESLFKSNLQQIEAKKKILKNQLTQKYNAIKDAKSQKATASSSLYMINQEIKTMAPMVKKGLSSNMDLLALKREKNSISQQYKSAKIAIPRLQAEVLEIKNKISEVDYIFQSNSKEQLSEAIAMLQGTDASKDALKDQVLRTLVRAPMNGIVQKLFVHTVSGVVQPGEDLVEIVPLDHQLIVEVKIKPSDIAFIYDGIEAMVKFSAFDFSIYGGLKGKVIQISPDTIKDNEGNQFYLIRIKTNKNSFEHNGKKMKIIPGMTVNVDILTGKKTVMDYILKPIIKAKQYTFTER
jgi:adhesin transport system membrane fusion protein